MMKTNFSLVAIVMDTALKNKIKDMKWIKDVWIDENNENDYSCQVTTDTDLPVAMVYGQTAEECELNLLIIENAPKMLELLKEFVNDGDKVTLRLEADYLLNKIFPLQNKN